MAEIEDFVFLFDVDNTLLDNDRVQADLKAYLRRNFGAEARDRYWTLLEELRAELGYVDCLGALEAMHNPRILLVASFLVDNPFAERLFPGALDAVEHVQRLGAAGHPLGRRRGVPAAQGRRLRPLARVRRPRAHLRP